MTTYLQGVNSSSSIEMKVCSCCLKNKPTQDFYFMKSKGGYFRPECKLCCRQKSKEYRKKNPDKVKQSNNKPSAVEARNEWKRKKREEKQQKKQKEELEIIQSSTKICRLCCVEKPKRDFYQSPRGVDNLMTACKKCCSEKNAESRLRRNGPPRKGPFVSYTREYKKAYYKKHYLGNKAVYTQRAGQRRALKMEATPSWLTDMDLMWIRNIYKMRERVSECLKVTHHVDHIIPLKNKLVCGLHVPWNLQVIPAVFNLKKSNKVGR